MKIKKVDAGIHTLELYALRLTYSQCQKCMDTLADLAPLKVLRRDPYNIDRTLLSNALGSSGIRLIPWQSHDCSNGIGIIINPNTLLDCSCSPIQLFDPSCKSCDRLLEQVEEVLHTLKLEDDPFYRNLIVQPEELSLSQMDLTMNLCFSKDADLVEIIRLFSKGNLPRSFDRKSCSTPEETSHCFIASSHTVTFKAYDKVYDLKRYGRCPPELEHKKILRIEVSLKRKSFLKKLELDRDDDLYTMLSTGYEAVWPVLENYLERLFPCSGTHRTYQETIRRIDSSNLPDTKKERMTYLVAKTSAGAGLDTALKKMKKEFSLSDYRTIDALYDAFEKLDINPITLCNNSDLSEVPSIRKMIKKSI